MQGHKVWYYYICLDSMYFEPARILALKGAQILFCPMFNRTNLDYHFAYHSKLVRQKSHFIACSSENQVWLVTSDIVWPYDGEWLCAGYTSLYNSEGECIKAVEPFSEGIIMHEIPSQELKKRKMKRVIGNPELMQMLYKEYESMEKE